MRIRRETVGEIWVRGDHVAMGYWRKPEQTARVFNAKLVSPAPGTPEGPWLRTGDLGVMSDGELFIMGRIKDLLIVDGRNHYPDDIEATIQEITGGRVAAISVPDDLTEQLVAIIELKRRGTSTEESMLKLRSVKREVTMAISKSHSLRVGRSRSGVTWFDPDHHKRQDPPFSLRRALSKRRIQTAGRVGMTASIGGEADLRHWLVDYLVTNIGCTPDEVDPDLSLADLGVSSRDAVVLSGELSELLGKTVSPIDFWEHPTINALAAYLTAPEPDPESESALKRTAQNSLDEPIAVIGMGCRFPGGYPGQKRCGSSSVTAVARSGRSPTNGGSRSTTARPK